jgi:hypothetical protein
VSSLLELGSCQGLTGFPMRRIEVLSEVRTGRRTVAAAAAVLAVSECQDRSRRVTRTYGWGHPGPFADYRLVIESVLSGDGTKAASTLRNMDACGKLSLSESPHGFSTTPL